MNIERIDSEELVQLIFTGKLQLTETRKLWESMVESFARKPVLWNFANCSFQDVNLDDLMKTIPEIQPLAEIRRGCRAALVAGKEVNFGFLKMVAALGERSGSPVDTRAFENEEQAREWLLEKTA